MHKVSISKKGVSISRDFSIMDSRTEIVFSLLNRREEVGQNMVWVTKDGREHTLIIGRLHCIDPKKKNGLRVINLV